MTEKRQAEEDNGMIDEGKLGLFAFLRKIVYV